MKIYDWIIIGGGIAGAAIAYELQQKNFKVLLIEQDVRPDNATRYSYGGLAFWSGTTTINSQLCEEGKIRHQVLSEELSGNTEFRELDLLLTIPVDMDPQKVKEDYTRFATPPKLLTTQGATELEPLLNPEAISGALTVKHGHIHPGKTTKAYLQAFLRSGGEIEIDKVVTFQHLEKVQSIGGNSATIKTLKNTYYAANIAVCAGGFSRNLLKASGINVPIYFTHAEIIETQPVDLHLSTLVMPTNLQRFQLESESTKNDELWDEPGNKLGNILDPGAVQFLDQSLRLGQISYVLTDPQSNMDAKNGEALLRDRIKNILPVIGKLPGSFHHCLVAFSKDSLPLIGSLPEQDNIYIFSGFSNPLVIIPPLAKRFANWVASSFEDDIIPQLSPERFGRGNW
ncbi:MAG: FAD-binding oxidoreductase [Mastigocoleus sp. MO_167.B18]|nr:FAD-binding oxidoreductase [Mastigocoleus sp. MO_167.B18]